MGNAIPPSYVEVFMRPLLRTLAAGAMGLLLSAPAGAATIVTLSLDALESSLTPEVGSAQSLSGSITLQVGTLPVGPGNTTLDVIGLAVSASGGATIGLDPDVLNPGLGVLTPAGSFLVPTLFVRITQGATVVDLPIPDVSGTVLFGDGGASLARLATSFGIDTGPPAGVVTVDVVAVPEPASLGLVAAGTIALAALRGNRKGIR
jgi:hypothetical protein